MTCKNIKCTHKFSSTHTGVELPTARRKTLSTYWNVQYVTFNTSEKLSNNLVNAIEAMQTANLTFHSADNSDRSSVILLLLLSTDNHDSYGKLKVTIIDHCPKWDEGKGKLRD
jgi:hypothetical protein